MVRVCPQFSGVEHISRESDEHGRVQDQAAAVLFLVVTGNALWDRRYDVGPRTRTEAELNEEINALRQLADRTEGCAGEYERLGFWREAATLRHFVTDTRRQADLRRPDSRNPWIVKRLSRRAGDDWDRGLVIEITQTCGMLFGKKMLGTVSTLSNVALDRNDITKSTVQGMVKRLR